MSERIDRSLFVLDLGSDDAARLETILRDRAAHRSPIEAALCIEVADQIAEALDEELPATGDA